MVAAWRYMAQRIDGSGQPGVWLDQDLPLTGVKLTKTLSGPDVISGAIDPVFRRLKGADGRPLLLKWGTVIHADADGRIAGSAIYSTGSFSGPSWSLSCTGFAGYPKGMGYEAEYSAVQVDPLDVVRNVWDTLQAGQDSDIGMVVDRSTTTPVRVGTPADSTSSAASSQSGPYEMNPWSTSDVGQVIDDLAKATPFDYRERHFWNARRDQVLHELVFGYPTLGSRRRDARFVIGENVQTVPDVNEDGPSPFANHVRFLGAGEGRDMVRADTMVSDGRLRRMATVDDKAVTGLAIAHRRAREELTRRLAPLDVTSIVARDTPTTPISEIEPGDEIRLQGEVDWVELDMWCRVVAVTISPDVPEIAGLSLVRADLS